MQADNQIRSPEELRALQNDRLAKDDEEVKVATQIAYDCLYKEINKSMATYSSLRGQVALGGECYKAFLTATRRFTNLPEHNHKEYGRSFDYRPFGWKRSFVEKEYRMPEYSTILFDFE